jgi:hypothetical protein
MTQPRFIRTNFDVRLDAPNLDDLVGDLDSRIGNVQLPPGLVSEDAKITHTCATCDTCVSCTHTCQGCTNNCTHGCLPDLGTGGLTSLPTWG